MTERILNAFLVRHLVVAVIFLIMMIIAMPIIFMVKFTEWTQGVSIDEQLKNFYAYRQI